MLKAGRIGAVPRSSLPPDKPLQRKELWLTFEQLRH